MWARPSSDMEHLEPSGAAPRAPLKSTSTAFRAPRAARRSTSHHPQGHPCRPQVHLAPPSAHLTPAAGAPRAAPRSTSHHPQEHLAPPSAHLEPPAGARRATPSSASSPFPNTAPRPRHSFPLSLARRPQGHWTTLRPGLRSSQAMRPSLLPASCRASDSPPLLTPRRLRP